MPMLTAGSRVLVRNLTIRTSRPSPVVRHLGDVRGTIQPRAHGVIGDGDGWELTPRQQPTRDRSGRYMVRLDTESPDDRGHVIFAHETELEAA